jgi:hypothetical protein
MHRFIEPFGVSIKAKSLQIDVISRLGDGLNGGSLDEIRHLLWTDWLRFEEILFHLVSNAIKFSLPQTTIQILFTFKSQPDQHMKLLPNALETRIINSGSSFDWKETNKHY